MNVKSEVNALQKRLLARLNVKTGSTLYIIIQEVSRQAYAKQSFVVSQKNSTLAEKCGVTASTISRNLKKIKEKCADLLTIEQNRNTGAQFAALVFTFVRQSNCEKNSHLKQHQTETSNGEQTEQVNSDAEPVEVAENTSNSFSKTNYNFYQNYNKNTNVNSKEVQQEKIIHNAYLKFKKHINKILFFKILAEVKSKKGIFNFKAYLEGALSNVANHIKCNNGTKMIEHRGLSDFYGVLMGE
ncbi:hypothetical protein C3744_20860 [Priestia megaterium]|uniref:Uncharacterized protein n=1 Tax=Priestia megaterium TaxID=1404 RepID=A0A3D8WXZ3_PRIMG|nr:hypothetical protein [Priestia megaterium]MDH3173639.1 hypothetical protein [Priestia megaterium]RDZ11515.1 hypothetical protein C3744_20860 [Priestia megaterium]